MMNQNTNGVKFQLTDDNNRSESAAKNVDILRGTANYITSENTFSLWWWVVFQKKSFHVQCKTEHTSSSDYPTWEILPNDILIYYSAGSRPWDKGWGIIHDTLNNGGPSLKMFWSATVLS